MTARSGDLEVPPDVVDASAKLAVGERWKLPVGAPGNLDVARHEDGVVQVGDARVGGAPSLDGG